MPLPPPNNDVKRTVNERPTKFEGKLSNVFTQADQAVRRIQESVIAAGQQLEKFSQDAFELAKGVCGQQPNTLEFESKFLDIVESHARVREAIQGQINAVESLKASAEKNLLEARDETRSGLNGVREEKDGVKQETEQALRTACGEAGQRFKRHEEAITQMLEDWRDVSGGQRSKDGTRARLIRGKDMHLDVLKDSPSNCDFADRLFDVELYLGPHDAWTEASQAMMGLRRATTELGIEACTEFVDEVAGSEFEQGFVEDDWTNFHEKGRELFTLIDPTLINTFKAIARKVKGRLGFEVHRRLAHTVNPAIGEFWIRHDARHTQIVNLRAESLTEIHKLIAKIDDTCEDFLAKVGKDAPPELRIRALWEGIAERNMDDAEHEGMDNEEATYEEVCAFVETDAQQTLVRSRIKTAGDGVKPMDLGMVGDGDGGTGGPEETGPDYACDLYKVGPGERQRWWQRRRQGQRSRHR